MKLTDRDLRIVRDIALSHVLSRDQLLRLGYFGSVTRLNARLRLLTARRLLRVFETPFFGQRLYIAGASAHEVVGDRIASFISDRPPTPRFVQHALAVTDTRIALIGAGCTDWRFEAQLRHSFLWCGEKREIRPDGMVRQGGQVTLLEVDMGHVDPAKFARKLRGYRAFIESGEATRIWSAVELKVLTVTTGKLRLSTLERCVPHDSAAGYRFTTFADLGVLLAGGWS